MKGRQRNYINMFNIIMILPLPAWVTSQTGGYIVKMRQACTADNLLYLPF